MEDESANSKIDQPVSEDNQMVQGDQHPVNQPYGAPETKKKSFIPKVLIVLFASLFFMGGAAAAYINFVQKSPDNLWKSALRNTATGMDRIIDLSATSPKGVKQSGNFKISSPIAMDGNMEGSSYESDGVLKANLGVSGARFDMEIRSIVPDGAANPDLYFKVGGLDGIDSLVTGLLGDDVGGVGQAFSELNEQWFFLDHTLLDQLMSESGASQTQISTEQAAQLGSELAEVLREYVFTTDQTKAIVGIDQKFGFEDFEGDKTYKVSLLLDKNNLKSFLNALVEKAENNELINELFLGPDQSLSELLELEDLMKSIDESDVSDVSMEAWIDSNGRFIRNVRIYPTEENKESNYLDIGLDYESGDVWPISLKAVFDENGDKGTLSVGLDFNQSDASTRIWFNVNAEGSVEIAAEGEITLSPTTEMIDVTAPDEPKNIFELIGGITETLLGQSGLDVDSDIDQLDYYSDFNYDLLDDQEL